MNAEKERKQAVQLSKTWPDIAIEDSYAISTEVAKRKIAAGAKLIGHKVGLTSKAMQRSSMIDEPDYGHLMSDMFIHDGQTVAADSYIQPRVEIEIAFVLGKCLGGGGVTAADVLRGTEFVLPSIEIIDSRIADWKCGLEDSIADNASSASVVLGGRATKLDGLDLRLSGALLERSGRIIETGVGAAVLGNPVVAVAWLANKLHEAEITLQEGDVVLAGACTRAVDVVAGDVIRAEFSNLGMVSVAFA
jgi:2-keto-4-pentenoate hydratase